MTDFTIPQRVLFPELGGKPVVATFDREQASSDGGAGCSRQPSGCTNSSRDSPGVWWTSARRRRFGTRWRTWSASGSSASRAVIRAEASVLAPLAGRAAEAAVNAFLVYRLGSAAVRLIQPIQRS